MSFQSKDIADYYNTTQNHYEKWWGLQDFLSLHYGVWDEDTRSFGEALRNTNKHLLSKAQISSEYHVLDAGCGVGGAAFYIHGQTKANVTGISLSEKQLELAQKTAQERKVEEAVHFELMDFCNTRFQDASFDVIWACESVCHTPDKADFLKEGFRLLKPGGRIVLFDFFLSKEDQEDKNEWVRKWRETWAVPNYPSKESFAQTIEACGFSSYKIFDYTDKIQKSAKRMYYAALAGAIPSETYNLLHPKVSHFAKGHYKCGYYQYKALKANLWKYALFQIIK